ncbi:flagellin [Terrilactibacillus laevilacticus]|uniref:flagellin N-terminal helical domain-containing protein n=1 Tax=Terrilactibacillus laevilacticus TaxID=1380157 RepID=UPI0011472DFE|nr:flagellin [Terrilactibacillus laevilacticus]
MIINHNIASLNTLNQMTKNNNATQKSIEKLSSGMRINSAADDAAGLAISEKMKGQIRGLDQASRNAQDATSLVQTAEGSLNETQDILQRMRELAVQAGSDTNTDTDRQNIQDEINSLTSEVNRIGNTTEFNTQKLLNGDKDSLAHAGKYEFTVTPDGTTAGSITIDSQSITVATTASAADIASAINSNTTLASVYTASAVDGKIVLTQDAGYESATAPSISASTATVSSLQTDEVGRAANVGTALQFQIGANEKQSLTLNISDMRAAALGISTAGSANADLAVTDGTNNLTTEQALDVSDATKAGTAVTKIQAAIDKVSKERSKLGATQNRLDHTVNNLTTSSENLTSAQSRIADVDMAAEMSNFTKNNILNQAAQAMLAQANQQPQGVLQLLR